MPVGFLTDEQRRSHGRYHFRLDGSVAAAAGLVPVLRASDKVSYHRRARKGNRALKRVFYRSAFCALSCHAPSQEYYRRKRTEGKGAPQAIIALARRRVNVLWAMLRDGALYEDGSAAAA